MRAAIYARKSTEQNVADESKSVVRQQDNARAFATAKGWTVADEHVFVDDGVGGAEFEKRPGLMRMMAAIKPSAPFGALIVSERKSIGREQFETGMIIKRLGQAGVEIFEYVHGRSLTPKNAMEKVLASVQGFADEDHREKTGERIYEALLRKTKQGYVTGGRLYGYRNVDVFDGVDQHGRPRRSHVEREIDAPEAQWVLRAFELYASGIGLKLIARRLTSEGAPLPKYTSPKKDGLSPLAGWAPSTVRAVLGREEYRGVIVWNRWRKRDDWGEVNPTPRPESEWVRTAAEHLRIVPEDLWVRVASRRADVEGKAIRFESGRLSGKPPKHHAPSLLAGMATCGLCGGGLMVVESGGPRVDCFDEEHLPAPGESVAPSPRGKYRYYACARRKHSGNCANALRVRLEAMDEAVLQAVEEHALTPEAVEQVIRLSERDDVRDRQEKLVAEAADVEKRIERLTAAMEVGGEVVTLMDRIKKHEWRMKQIAVEQADLRPVPRLAPAVVEGRLAEWRRLLRQSTTQGRAVLQRVIRGRLTFTPRADGKGYDFSGDTRFARLFAGVVTPRPAFVADGAAGTEHIRPEDTLEADYGRLLERAERVAEPGDKGWRPWRDSNPRSSP
jgi:site-specific DNA recombinase